MFQATRRLLQHRQPLIKFIGKHTAPAKIDHTPHTHPASPVALPNSFAAYRQAVQQHGPLNTKAVSGGYIGGHSGSELGPVEAGKGQYFDVSELPAKWHRVPWSQKEMEAIESGGASMW
ncbi:hypothetical protein BLS_003561 [Venturia inaequalis]|uniref:Uncharacterized protein n=1 Tax=Venturia inaequalis TaxID=5025 RepID=A0A8H3U0Q3_VENIN|nr:hypothetical protein BLS_003561 [Venturia inaequalis]KAE9964125.1 hypothetical protein EG328_010782 [Venturia inaequalis]KAE9972784.1 hypothetical protein EG327_009378 [Venturia inaequalis]